jgi:hypothetical protein
LAAVCDPQPDRRALFAKREAGNVRHDEFSPARALGLMGQLAASQGVCLPNAGRSILEDVGSCSLACVWSAWPHARPSGRLILGQSRTSCSRKVRGAVSRQP